jgi:hypothetical protein
MQNRILQETPKQESEMMDLESEDNDWAFMDY